jgi:hypothetical protein
LVEAPRSPAPASLERIERLHWALLAVVALAAFAVPGLQPGSVAAGGVFMGLNVLLMKRLLGRLAGSPGPRHPGPAIFLLGAKTCLFLALLALLFWRVPIDGLSFAVGASVFLVAAVVGAVLPGARSQGES